MITVNTEAEMGVLQINLDGSWSPREFIKLLDHVDDSYKRINTFTFFESIISSEVAIIEEYEPRRYNVPTDSKQYKEAIRKLEGAKYFHNIYFGNERFSRDGNFIERVRVPFNELVFVAEQFTGVPQLKSISYASPGWIEIIGNWNPIKVMADMIVAIGNQRIERQKIESAERMANAQLQASLMREILANSILMKKGDPESIRIIIKEVIEPINTSMKSISMDSRITGARVLPLEHRKVRTK